MPRKYVTRNFYPEGFYHIFNRSLSDGVGLFSDEYDRRTFMYYLFIYLAPLNAVLNEYPTLPLAKYPKNLNGEVVLLAYCLMPNHFHLLLQQKTKDGISRLMRQLANGYTSYYNQKNGRMGNLFQCRFKATEIKSEEQLLHVSRYIHLNPLVARLTDNLGQYQWSSFPSYVNGKIDPVCDASIILSHFSKPGNYNAFVLDNAAYAASLAEIKHLLVDYKN